MDFLTSSLLGICGLLGIMVLVLLWDKPVLVIYIEILYCCVMRFMIQVVGFPDIIKYLTDALALLMILQLIFLPRGGRARPEIFKPVTSILLLSIVAIASFIGSGFAPLPLIWGIRVIYRFYAIFVASAVFLSMDDVRRLVKLILFLLPVNCLISMIQYFVFGLTHDFNGGLFGIQHGCNTEMNLYLIVVCIFAVALYIYHKQNLIITGLILSMCLLIAALSELKVVFLEVLVILAIAVVMTLSHKRSLIIAAGGLAAVYFGSILFLFLYPNWDMDFFTAKGMISYSMDYGYLGEGSLNRFSAMQYIASVFLDTLWKFLFGIGLGNGDTSILYTSQFFARYGDLGYNLFAHAFFLLEAGVLGLLCYLLFFGGIFQDALRIRRYVHPDHVPYCVMGAMAVPMAVILMIYNQSIRMEVAYMLFACCAFPYVAQRDLSENGNALGKIRGY